MKTSYLENTEKAAPHLPLTPAEPLSFLELLSVRIVQLDNVAVITSPEDGANSGLKSVEVAPRPVTLQVDYVQLTN